MIVLDTNVLVYATSEGHPLVEPSRRLVAAVSEGAIRATTTPQVIQEFAHVAARRRGRAEAARLARRWLALLAPVVSAASEDLERALRLFERGRELDAFDALLAAVTMRLERGTLVSADGAFASVRGLRHVDPATPELDALLA